MNLVYNQRDSDSLPQRESEESCERPVVINFENDFHLMLMEHLLMLMHFILISF